MIGVIISFIIIFVAVYIIMEWNSYWAYPYLRVRTSIKIAAAITGTLMIVTCALYLISRIVGGM